MRNEQGCARPCASRSLAQVVDQLEDVEAQLLDLAVLLLVEAPHQHVGVQRLGGEEGRDLFADDEVVVAEPGAERPRSCRDR